MKQDEKKYWMPKTARQICYIICVTERLGDILENVFDFLLPERYAEQLERRIDNEREMLRV